MYWDQLTSPQLDDINRSTPVILPISATEQHGPHLPMATDRLIGEHFCTELNKKMGSQILILPSLGIGCSEHHTLFPGSLSLTHATFTNQMQDIFHWVSHHGFRKLVIFNSHGGNQAVGQSFLEQFGFRHPECQLVLMTWWQIAAEALAKIAEGGPVATGHAGEMETSLMLLIAPHLVQEKLIPAFANLPTHDWAKGSLLGGPKASLYRNFKQISPNGTMGKPLLATKEKGMAITNVVIEAFGKILSSL